MKPYVPCLAWTLCGVTLIAFWWGRLARDSVEPWLWCVVGLVLIAAGVQSGLEARRTAAGADASTAEEERA